VSVTMGQFKWQQFKWQFGPVIMTLVTATELNILSRVNTSNNNSRKF